MRGIVEEVGVFDHPDALYAQEGTNLRGGRRFAYRLLLRHAMNRTVDAIRRDAVTWRG